MTREKLLAKVDAEIEAGQQWRAKEILRGSIQAVAADPILLERYGQLLETLGDRLEAGKYYFLSGVRAPTYLAAIELFLHRYSRSGPQQLLRQFPSAVRQVGFARLSETTQRDLRRLGLEPKNFDPRRRAPAAANANGWARSIPAIVVLVLLLIGVGVGIRTVWGWASRLFD